MKLKIRVMGYDIPAESSAQIELADGSSVRDALSEYLRQSEVGVDLKELSKSQFLVNGKACPVDRTLNDGDELTVLRLLGGG